MSSSDEAKWHWAEGMKYALEGIKLLFVLNGAAAVSILTFVGNAKAGSNLLVSAMLCFAFGAATTVVVMLFAYFTQLNYGNASLDQSAAQPLWEAAVRKHNRAYLFIGLSLLCFLVGVCLAAGGLMHVSREDLPCLHLP